MKVIGIDPGTATLGWGYLEFDDRADPVKDTLVYGAIRTKSGLSDADRLVIIAEEISKLIKTHKPQVVGVEGLYFNKNVSSAISVAQARGVVMQLCRKKGASIIEITPPEVKESIVGYGKADKHQVQNMVRMLLGLEDVPRPDDAADAIAVALATARMAQFEQQLDKS